MRDRVRMKLEALFFVNEMDQINLLYLVNNLLKYSIMKKIVDEIK